MSEHHLREFTEPFELGPGPYQGHRIELDSTPIDSQSRAFNAWFVQHDDEWSEPLEEDGEQAGLVAKTPFASRDLPDGYDAREHNESFTNANWLFSREQIALSRIYQALMKGDDVGWLVRPAERPGERDRFFLVERYGPSLSRLRDDLHNGRLAKDDPDIHRLLALAAACGARSLKALAGMKIVHRDPHPGNFMFEHIAGGGDMAFLDARMVWLADLDHADSPEFSTELVTATSKALLGHAGFQSPRIWQAYKNRWWRREINVTFDYDTDLFGLATSLAWVLVDEGPWRVGDRRHGVHPDPHVVARGHLPPTDHGSKGHTCAYDRDETCRFGSGYSRGDVAYDPQVTLDKLAQWLDTEWGRKVHAFITLVFEIASPESLAADAKIVAARRQLNYLVEDLCVGLGVHPSNRPPMGTYPALAPEAVNAIAAHGLDAIGFANPFVGHAGAGSAQRARLERAYGVRREHHAADEAADLDAAKAAEARLAQERQQRDKEEREQAKAEAAKAEKERKEALARQREQERDAKRIVDEAAAAAKEAARKADADAKAEQKATRRTARQEKRSSDGATVAASMAVLVVAAIGLGLTVLGIVPATLGAWTWEASGLGLVVGAIAMILVVFVFASQKEDNKAALVMTGALAGALALCWVQLGTDLSGYVYAAGAAIAAAAPTYLMFGPLHLKSPLFGALRGVWAAFPMLVLPLGWVLEWALREYVPIVSWRVVDWDPVQQIVLGIAICVLWMVTVATEMKNS